MKKMLTLILFLCFLVSCSQSDSSQVITSEVPDSDVNESPPALIEESEDATTTDLDHPEIFLEFNLTDEVVRISLYKVPILNKYLEVTRNRQYAINKMNLSPITFADSNKMYLLEFACIDDQCSYLLLDQKEEGRSFLVADLTKLDTITLSPDYNKLLLVFKKSNQAEDVAIEKHKLIVMDLTNWKTLQLSTNHELTFDYSWPILNPVWKDNQTIVVDVPTVEQSIVTLDQLVNWYQSDKKVTSVEVDIIEN